MLSIVLAAVFVPAGCGPEADSWQTWPRVQRQPETVSEPLASSMPPFSLSQSDAAGDSAAETLEPPAGSELDQRVQKYVARFPGEEDGRQVRSVPAQSPPPAQPARTPAGHAPVAQSSAGQAVAPVAQPSTGQAANPSSPVAPAPVANRPVVQAMRPVQPPAPAQAAASTGQVPGQPPAAAPAHSEVQASPQPLKFDAPNPLTEPGQPRVELIDVRPAVGVSAEANADETASSANQPVQPTPVTREGDLGAIVSRLEASVQNHPQHLDEQFRLRLLYLATGQDEKAVAPIKGADPLQAGLVTTLFQAVSSTRDAIQQPTSSPAPALLAADELRRLLGQRTSVIIPRIALVTRVNSFGDYEAVDPPKFPAGQSVHVFLYTEVANFRSEPTEDDRLRTLLSEKVEIFDATGKIIWQQEAPEIEDRVLTPRRDFFIPLEVRLPASTPPGEYVLKVTIEDKLGATTDQRRLTFVIE